MRLFDVAAAGGLFNAGRDHPPTCCESGLAAGISPGASIVRWRKKRRPWPWAAWRSMISHFDHETQIKDQTQIDDQT